MTQLYGGIILTANLLTSLQKLELQDFRRTLFVRRFVFVSEENSAERTGTYHFVQFLCFFEGGSGNVQQDTLIFAPSM